jgi:hypothetical protein
MLNLRVLPQRKKARTAQLIYRWTLGRMAEECGSIPGGARDLSTDPKLALGPTQSPIHLLRRGLSPGIKR